jgi:hypothetical protein
MANPMAYRAYLLLLRNNDRPKDALADGFGWPHHHEKP